MSNRELVDSTPSLATLAHVLRHKELWPAGFTWDFGCRQHCAMGLASQLWPRDVVTCDHEYLAEVFKMPVRAAERIFHGGIGWSLFVTPNVVARRIDKYLAEA